jgi:hypothetical protein
MEPGVMRIQGKPDHVYVVTVLDVSKSGLRVSCASALPVATQVEVKCRGAGVTGEIRYCRDVKPAEFNLGIKAYEASSGAGPQAAGRVDLTLLFKVI